MPANERENLMTEIVVIGGGPAGLSAALVFSRRGLDTTVIEKRSFPVIKACGEGLMPGGVDSLKRLVPQELINKIELKRTKNTLILLKARPSGHSAMMELWIPRKISEAIHWPYLR